MPAPLTPLESPPALTHDEISDLVDDYGLFRNGYTPDDIEETLPHWERFLGLRLACVWTNNLGQDQCGGDSEIVVRHSARQLAALPDGVWAYLLGDGDGFPTDELGDPSLARAMHLGELRARTAMTTLFPYPQPTGLRTRTPRNLSPKG